MPFKLKQSNKLTLPDLKYIAIIIHCNLYGYDTGLKLGRYNRIESIETEFDLA